MAHGDITHIEIPVDDMAAAKDFYSQLFGWDIQTPPGFEDYPMWRAPNSISGGGLVQRSDDFTQPRSFVEVDSIDETIAAAEALGSQVVQPKQPITESSAWAVILDPSGNVLGLYEGNPGSA